MVFIEKLPYKGDTVTFDRFSPLLTRESVFWLARLEGATVTAKRREKRQEQKGPHL